ncbi:MAG: P-loop NTPase fold protein, partial [Salinivirgaceae bacterium]|nr:P-loop NTPase fold protein [Salinivirgaceae bacterium]
MNSKNNSATKIYDFLNHSNLKLLLGLAAILIIYINLNFSRYLAINFAQPIFSKILDEGAINWLFVIGLIWISLLVVLKQVLFKYRLEKFMINFIILYLLIFFYERIFNNSSWNFLTFFSTEIAYLDGIAFIGGLLVLFHFYNRLKSIQDVELLEGFIIDTYKDKEDELDRYKFALDLYEKITNSIQNNNVALGVGISGEWGSGKSFLLNQIEKLAKLDSNIILVSFEPWKCASKEHIVEDFLNQFASQLGKYNAVLKNEISQYINILAETSENSLIKKAVKTLKQVENKIASDKYDSINKCIGEIGNSIIVTIDDLDRLQKEEILEVFRLIRNIANFQKTCFLATYDKEYITTTVSDNGDKEKNKEYIHKIIQYEFKLPQFEYVHLLRFVKSHKDKFSIEGFENVVDNNLSHLKTVVKTHRDAIRFLNALWVDYSHLNADTDFRDLFLLNLLKLKIEDVYFIFHSFFEAIRDEINPDFRKQLNSILNENLKDNIALKDIAFQILNELLHIESFYNDSGIWKNKEVHFNSNKIVSPAKWHVYFSLGVRENEIPCLNVISACSNEDNIVEWINDKSQSVESTIHKLSQIFLLIDEKFIQTKKFLLNLIEGYQYLSIYNAQWYSNFDKSFLFTMEKINGIKMLHKVWKSYIKVEDDKNFENELIDLWLNNIENKDYPY